MKCVLCDQGYYAVYSSEGNGRHKRNSVDKYSVEGSTWPPLTLIYLFICASQLHLYRDWT